MIIQYTLFLFGLIWSFSIIKTQSIFNKKVGLIFKIFISKISWFSFIAACYFGFKNFSIELTFIGIITSILNEEKREGSYHCANCDVKLFDSSSKYESGSGWPSFYESLPNVFETKTDHHIGYARTEYHCKKCGGHHGHIFDDGPQPTGKRYCNNGVCLVFKPK